MNFILKTYSGKVVFRPDTSRKRDEDDLYLPDFISSLSYSPVVYLRMDRPGKCIASRFASRYYSNVGFGLMLFPDDLIDGSSEGFASALCVDRMSCIPTQMQDLSYLQKEFSIRKDSNILYTYQQIQTSLLDDAIEFASSRCFLRTGDILCIELSPRSFLCSRDESECTIESEVLSSFRIIY